MLHQAAKQRSAYANDQTNNKQTNARIQGVRVSLVKPAIINQRANAYLANHPELYTNAKPVVERMILAGTFGKRAQREPSSVQILGAK